MNELRKFQVIDKLISFLEMLLGPFHAVEE